MSESIRAAYHRRVAFDPGARARLDRALSALPAPRRRLDRLAWLGAPRAWRMRPGLAVAAGVLVLAAGFALGRNVTRPGARVAEVAPVRPAAVIREVQFVLVAPRASRVAVVGDWNGWDPAATPMERRGGETWIVRVTLPAGRHVYAFVMDGDRWISDPLAPLAPANEFGARNSVIVVGESSPL